MFRTDPLLLKMFGLSLALHIVVMGTQAVRAGKPQPPELRRVLHLAKESRSMREEVRPKTELRRRIRAKLADVAVPSVSSPRAVAAGVEPSQLPLPDLPQAARLGATGPGAQTSGRRGSGASAATRDATWASAIDLTNITAAADGDPVLLSYFSAIREQIQQAANGQSWVPEEAREEGVVYVAFVIASSGDIQSLSLAADRSTGSSVLQEAAVKIIQSAGPFPPLPPSFVANSPSMTVSVPIEFVPGGA